MRTNPRILVVDDVADNRTILSRTLRRRGFDVIEAENGHAALAEITAHDFDLAFHIQERAPLVLPSFFIAG